MIIKQTHDVNHYYLVAGNLNNVHGTYLSLHHKIISLIE